MAKAGHDFEISSDGRIAVNTESGISSSGYLIADQTATFPPFAKPQPWVNPSDFVTQFQAGHGWTGSSGFVANDTADFVLGTQSAKLTTSSTGTFKIQSPALTLDLTAKQLRVRVKIDDITNVNAMNVWAGNDATITNGYKWFVQGTLAGSNQIISGTTTPQVGWVTVVLNVADAQLIGSPTRTGIVCIKFEISRTAAAGEVTLHTQDVALLPEPTTLYPNGAVIICADDILGEQWTNMLPILEPYGFRANFFVIVDQVGGSNRLTLNQLHALQDQGHEIHAHAWTDADHTASYTGLSAAALDTDLRLMKGWMNGQGFRGQGTAYPLGQYGVTTDGVPTTSIVQRYYSFARADSSGTNKPSGTYPLGDPYRLPSLSSITTFAGGFTPTNLIGTGVGGLQTVAATHGVKIMTFHKVVTGTPGASSEIKTTDFQSIMDEIHTLGMRVLTFSEYLAGT